MIQRRSGVELRSRRLARSDEARQEKEHGAARGVGPAPRPVWRKCTAASKEMESSGKAPRPVPCRLRPWYALRPNGRAKGLDIFHGFYGEERIICGT